MAVSSDNSVCYTNLLFITFIFPQVIVEVIEERKISGFQRSSDSFDQEQSPAQKKKASWDEAKLDMEKQWEKSPGNEYRQMHTFNLVVKKG